MMFTPCVCKTVQIHVDNYPKQFVKQRMNGLKSTEKSTFVESFLNAKLCKTDQRKRKKKKEL